MKRRSFLKRAAAAGYVAAFGLPAIVGASVEQDRNARIIALLEKRIAQTHADMLEHIYGGGSFGAKTDLYIGAAAPSKTDMNLFRVAREYDWKQVSASIVID